MNKWVVPKSFMLFGSRITVVARKKLWDNHDAWGRWLKPKNRIELQTPSKEMGQEVFEQAFWHEATHAFLDALGYTEDSKDEEKVDRIGSAIHQIIKSSRGELGE